MEWTESIDRRLRDYLARPGYEIPAGLGTDDAACSMAAINLAAGYGMTDEPPDCMSYVIGRLIVSVQDAMPPYMRNGHEWRELLPLAAGTGRDHEAERISVVLDWMCCTVLPLFQPRADRLGCGDKFRLIHIAMLDRDFGAFDQPHYCPGGTEISDVEWATRAIANACDLTSSYSDTDVEFGRSGEMADAAVSAAHGVSMALVAALRADYAAFMKPRDTAAWLVHMDPIRLLRRLIDVHRGVK